MKPLDGMRLILAVPTYGASDEQCQKDLRISIMSTSSLGAQWMGDASTRRMGWSMARNTSTQLMLETEANGIMWVDSDIRTQPHDMVKILDRANANKHDFVSAVYHQRGEPYDPCFYKWRPKSNLFAAPLDYSADTYSPFDGCGFGFVYTSRRMIEAIARSKHFDSKKGWFPDERQQCGYGEDLSFSYLAMLCGFRCWVDTGVVVGHSGDPYVQYKPEKEYQAKKIKERYVQPPEGEKEEWKWGIRPWHAAKQ